MKTVLITGASRGLGQALAESLARQGYKLIVTARGAEGLERNAARWREHTEVVALAGDVASAAHRRALAKAASSGLDVLVNNASDLGQTPLPELAEADLERLQQLYDTNLIAPLGLIQATLPQLKKRRGLVVNLSSDAAVGGYEGWGGYGSSKAALDLVSKTLAAELLPQGVGVVAVDPGDMRTQMHQDAFPGKDISDRPLPEATLPFWLWLLCQNPRDVSGQRFRAQADTWTLNETARAATAGQPA
jgi:NAD(P)-dependent dehydrogenase (short-subunit alcohol dehydrogenase family)